MAESWTLDFIRKMFNAMKLKYRERKEAYRREKEASGYKVIFVHELVECGYKRVLREKFPEAEEAAELNPRFILGELIHLAIRNLTGSRDEVYERGIEVGDVRFLIVGSPDVVLEDKLLEIKYQTGIVELPQEHHVRQSRLYAWLTKKPCELVYITPQGIKGFVLEPYTDDEVMRIITEDKFPIWEEWECSYCWYNSWCPHELARRRRRTQ